MKWLVIVVATVVSVSCTDRSEDADQSLDSAPAVVVPPPPDSVLPDSVMARDTARVSTER
ncbi:MAG: hypothetical protein OEO20_09595 [Gemmatimonadota bacterium]|nr:hypothetical protein [Gemmatimonadota bacterium]MDH3367392.1 hypothetical protein [Gemmatimonadota bacterium]MDH3478545.1 hypothetical protein [Gemmatimonadota bacterium]MDH3569949.1 hypothetical protein [Gemmatimonadota bacterium]MDH5549701.1 hypothetical protein [Gemmatimonadota bacterium]